MIIIIIIIMIIMIIIIIIIIIIITTTTITTTTTTTTTIIIIIIKIADNITAFPLLELCSTGCSDVTIKCLNHEWATFVLEYLS
jgi:hypothetical protein